MPRSSKTVTVKLNGSTLVFARKNGVLLSLTEPEGNRLIDTTADRGGLIDVACPLKGFGPFRLASRFSSGCRITVDGSSVSVFYPVLGGSRTDVRWKGRVSANVTISAHADGRSLVFEAWVKNSSRRLVPQVLFPDFQGLVPLDGPERAWFRQGGVKMRPYLDLNEAGQWGINQFWRGTWWEFFEPGKGWWGGTALGRWSHFGSKRAGLGIFETGWHPDPEHAVLLRVPEDEPRLARLCFTRELTNWRQFEGHLRVIPGEGAAPGKTWRSSQFVVTPHAGTWPHGIQTYRQQVRSRPCATVSTHVKEDIGFRTIFMFEMEEFNPARCHFRWRDLPRLARESAAVGIRELNLWGALRPFRLPLQSYPVLGTPAEFRRAMRACRALGVNVSLMLSVYTLDAKTGKRFGTGGKVEAGWSYHTEAIPPINPGYYTSYAGAGVDPSNRKWQAAVLSGIKRLIKDAPCSICWDQYLAGNTDRSIDDLAATIFRTTQQGNPHATFSGESCGTLEAESNVLHYTWNWRADAIELFPSAHRMPDYAAPALSVWRAPRLNLNVETDRIRILKGFADNLYLNFLPRCKNGIWGSGEFSEHPQLEKLIGELSRLRRRSLAFFTEGESLGEGLVCEELDGIHTSAYRHENQLLLIVVDERRSGPARPVQLSVELHRWLKDLPKAAVESISGFRGPAPKATIRSGRLTLDWKAMNPSSIRAYRIS